MKYKITLKNQVAVLGFSFLIILGIVLFVIYQDNKGNFDINLRNAIGIFALISFVPVLYLHIEYYCFNIGSRFIIDIYEKKITYIYSTEDERVFGFDEIDKVVLYMAPSLYRGNGLQLLPFEQYHYARIITKNKNEIIITCLMIKRVQDAMINMRGVTVEKKKRIFASILLENLWSK